MTPPSRIRGRCERWSDLDLIAWIEHQPIMTIPGLWLVVDVYPGRADDGEAFQDVSLRTVNSYRRLGIVR